MRARYYSPELRRFINADIIAGEISEAITLNRYAYANGNPVSFVDPFGLSAERMSLSLDDPSDFRQAVLVTRFDEDGLEVLGHTQLYFLDEITKTWYKTEFTTSGGDNLKQKKKDARVFYYDETPIFYNNTTGKFKEVKGMNFVVLNGDFNKSVAKAKEYANMKDNNFNGYNFLFKNCSDYTDAILDEAKVEGFFTQMVIDGDSLISSPVIREAELSFWQYVDKKIDKVVDFAKKAWDFVTFWD